MTSTISAITQTTQPFNPEILLNNPFVQYIISPVIVFGILLYGISRIYNLGGFMNKVSTALDNLTNLDKEVKKLNSHVDVIKTHLVTNSGLSASLFAPGSPLKLLPGGIELLNKSGFKDIYENNKEWFISEIKKHPVATLSEIDDASLEVIEDCSKGEKFANYKELAFQHGVTIDVLLRVLSIYLRDEVAKEILPARKVK
jgi:hypothetical protein